MTKPIQLHYWPTPNGWKISIMLEECGLPYEVIPVAIGKGEQVEKAGDPQTAGDLLVGQPGHHQLEHLALAGAQLLGRSGPALGVEERPGRLGVQG